MEKNPNLKGLLTLKRINEAFSVGLGGGVSVALVQTFIVAALNEGKGVNELALLAKMPRVTVSRHLLDLAANHRESGKGRSLLERVENPKDLRSTIYKLSPKGKMLIGQLMDALAELPADNPEVGTEG